MAEVELTSVRKSYGHVVAVKDISLEIKDREFVVLVGPSGCGKSTTLRMIAGLEEISSGTIAIGGRVVNHLQPKDRDIAMVFQNYALYQHMSVHDNLAFGLRNRHVPEAEIAAAVNRAARILSIEPLLDRRPRQLSGGQQQRVALGRCIVRNPKVFLFDEPLSNLDAQLRAQMRLELKELRLRVPTTSIFVTHDQVEAMTMGDRIGVLSKGELVQVGTPYQVYNFPANTFVASFVGAPAINLFVAAMQTGKAVVVSERFEFSLSAGARTRCQEIAGTRAKVCVGVRPEDVKLVDHGGIEGTVYGAENHGAEMILTISVADHFIRATTPPSVEVTLNQRVQIAFVQEKLHFLTSGRPKTWPGACLDPQLFSRSTKPPAEPLLIPRR